MKWYQDEKGNTSMMRILSMIAGFTGIIISLSGVVAMFLKLSTSGTAMSIGAGILGAALGAKAWQKISEKG